MTISSWVNNSRVTISILKYEGQNFLVYTSDVAAHRVMLVEDINSGIKEIPDQSVIIRSSEDMDRLIKETMDKIISMAGYKNK